MPRVRLLTSVAGEDFAWQAGDEVDMTADQAKVWADGIRGELVRTETLETPENNRRRRSGKAETPED